MIVVTIEIFVSIWRKFKTKLVNPKNQKVIFTIIFTAQLANYVMHSSGFYEARGGGGGGCKRLFSSGFRTPVDLNVPPLHYFVISIFGRLNFFYSNLSGEKITRGQLFRHFLRKSGEKDCSYHPTRCLNYKFKVKIFAYSKILNRPNSMLQPNFELFLKLIKSPLTHYFHKKNAREFSHNNQIVNF